MNEQEIKLECLRIVDGSLGDAQSLYDWVMGQDKTDGASTAEKMLPAVTTLVVGKPPYTISTTWKSIDEIQIILQGERSKT